MREIVFKMERPGLVEVGQEVDVSESITPVNVNYMIEPAVAMSGLFRFTERLKSKKGIVKDIIQNDRGSSFVINQEMLEVFAGGEDSLEPFVTSLLKTADINISGYSINSMTRNVPGGILKSYNLSTNHTVKNEAGVHEYTLPFDAESEGTKRIFVFGPIIKDAIENGRTIIVDEIDNSLHPLFLEYLINLFNKKETNTNNAQLIFNTHSVETLSLDILRRDQIYFVEKNNEDGVTEIYSLDEFSPRKTENVRKGYLQGRYGAIPDIGLEDLKW